MNRHPAGGRAGVTPDLAGRRGRDDPRRGGVRLAAVPAPELGMSPEQAPIVFALVLPIVLAVVLAEITADGWTSAPGDAGVLAAVGTIPGR
ncbi:MAG: hypothetical protein R2719_15750 [Micropruina sp.]